MVGKSKQEIEAAVGKAISNFLKEHMAEHVEALAVQLVEDTLIVRLKDVLTPAEKCLIKDGEGIRLIAELKEKLMEGSKVNLKTMIENLSDVEIVDIHTSFNIEASELVIVFALAKDLGKSF